MKIYVYKKCALDDLITDTCVIFDELIHKNWD